jgi:TolA-binding protein
VPATVARTRPGDSTPGPGTSSAIPQATIKAPAPGAKLSAEEVATLYKAGVQQYMNEEYDKAIVSFQKVVKADPGHAKAKEYQAKARARLKKR